MKQKTKVKQAPKWGLFRRAMPFMVVAIVAVVGVWLLTASHADTLPCGSVVDNKISFQVCPAALPNGQVATKVTATSHFFGLVPTKSLASVQQCDAAGNNCANVVATSGDYTDTGNAVYTLQSTGAQVQPVLKYRFCAFVADSTGWNGGTCSVPIAGTLLTATSTTTTTTTPTTTTTTTTTTTGTKTTTGTPTTPTTTTTGTTGTTTTPPVVTTTTTTTPTTPSQAQTAAADAAAKNALLIKFYQGIEQQQQQQALLAKFYKGVEQQVQQANAFLTAVNNMCPSPKPLLAPGAYGSCVKFLQFFLNVKANAGLAVDGSYGPSTTSAVMNYQRTHGLSVDGVTGNQTWTYLLTGQTVPVTQFPPAGSSRGGGGSSSGGGSTQTGGGDPTCQQLANQYASQYANFNNCAPPACLQYASIFANTNNCGLAGPVIPQTPTPTASHRPPPTP